MDQYLNDLNAVITDYKERELEQMPNLNESGNLTKYEQIYEIVRREMIC